jgi:hypothetical protein
MNVATPGLAIAFMLAGADVLAQGGVAAAERLQACSLLAPAERTECLEKLARDLGPPAEPQTAVSPGARPAPAGSEWIISETRSPIDYTPVAIATAASRAEPDGSAVQLSIQCRGGRTDLVISGSALTRRGEDYVVSYAVNDSKAVPLAGGTPASGMGIALKGDVVRLLASLPEQGSIVFGVTARRGVALEGRYDLAGLKAVLERLATPCKWPAGAAPRNR